MAIRDLPKTPMEQLQGLLGPYISAIPVLGTTDAAIRAGKAAVSGNYAGAAEALADVIPVGRGVSRAVKAITKGKSAGDVGGLLNIRAPQQDALDLAQKRAALPVSEGGLGLPPDNTPMQRAKALGNDIPGLHGTTESYSATAENPRGVYFTTPDSEFANRYAGDFASVNYGASPNVIPTLSRASKVFDYENKDQVKELAQKASLGKLAIDQIKKGDWRRLEDRTLLNTIRKLGYDGLYVNEEGIKNFAAFSPEQIRSRFAAFDPFRRNESDLLAIQGGSSTSGLDSANLNRYETEADRRMEIARRNAALPVEQGGLGLPENNTPMDRAKAMGYVDRVYHGTDKDFGAFDPAMSRQDVQYMPGIFTADDPDMSSAYGDRILPLLQKRGTTVMDKREARRSGAEIPTVDTIYDKQKGIRVTTDPTNLRSVFAAFDPMRRNEADLLAFRGNIGTSNLLNINPLLGLLENP